MTTHAPRTTNASSRRDAPRWRARPHHLWYGMLLLTSLSCVTTWLAFRFGGAGHASTGLALTHKERTEAEWHGSKRNAEGEEGAGGGGEGAAATATVTTTTSAAASHAGRRKAKAKARKPSEHRSTAATDEEKTRDRRGAMTADAGTFSYVHISKCGGASWIQLLKQLHLDVYPVHRAGHDEYSVHHQRTAVGRRAAYHLTGLRSPRHHVYSMFLHCKYYRKQWGWDGEDRADFAAWLDHHVPMGPDNRDLYRCYYHPANYQARHLTSRAARPHGLDGGEPFAPDARAARRTYRGLDFVGLTEFTHEARCLLYHRLARSALPGAVAYLDGACRCGAPGHEEEHTAAHRSKSKAAKGARDVRVTHHDGPHQSALRDFPRDLLSKVDALTRVDADVYALALRQFLAEVAWLESAAALGRRVLCDAALRRLEPELRYLPAAGGRGTNVTALYWEARRGSGASL